MDLVISLSKDRFMLFGSFFLVLMSECLIFFLNFICGKFQLELGENAFNLLSKRGKLSPLPS